MPRREFIVSILTHPPREVNSVTDTLQRICFPRMLFGIGEDRKPLPHIFSSLMKGEVTKSSLKTDEVPPVFVPPIFHYPQQVWSIFEATFKVEMLEPHVIFAERGTKLAPQEDQQRWTPDFPWILAFREALLQRHLGAMTATVEGGLLHWTEGGVNPLQEQFINICYVTASLPMVHIPTPDEVAKLVRKYWPEKKK